MAVDPEVKGTTLMSHHHGTASGKDPRQLVALLHGYGADGADLIGLAPYLGQALPDAAFVAPNAPFPCAMAVWGFQWFDIQDAGPERRLEGARFAAKILHPFFDAQLEAHGVPPEELYILGFSQGMMMALHVGLRRSVAPQAVIGISGRLLGPDLLAAEMTCRPPVLLVHGDQDEVVSPDQQELARTALRAAGLDVESHRIAGLGHGIDEQAILYTARFLRRIAEAS
jgi:phospholipase/carboxylesterase